MFGRALLAFLALPGLAAGLAPLIIAYVDPWRRGQLWPPGLVVMIGGALILLWCVQDFYISGKGTLAPWAPPKHLVIVGLYRLTRNPMYIGVLVLVFGWALYLQAPFLAGYLILLALGFHIRIIRPEEPWLDSQFGPAWHAYKASVPRWVPWNRSRQDSF